MKETRYTLDRIEEAMYVFLEKGNEDNQLVIRENEIPTSLTEGDIVHISKEENGYQIDVLKEETGNRKKQVNDLIEKLKNKN